MIVPLYVLLNDLCWSIDIHTSKIGCYCVSNAALFTATQISLEMSFSREWVPITINTLAELEEKLAALSTRAV